MGKQRAQSAGRSEVSTDKESRVDMAKILSEIKAQISGEALVSKTRHDAICEKLDAVMKENVKLKGEILKLNKKVMEQDKEIHVLNGQVNDLMQDKINKNVVIKGVPEVGSNEVVESLVPLVFRELNIALEDYKIISAKRIGQPEAGRKRPIVVSLLDMESKTKIIRAKRKKNLDASMFLCGENPLGKESDKIFIDEHLTKNNMHLFMEARKLRSMGIKYVWTNNGAILIRKEEKEKIIRIHDFRQLSSIFIELSKCPTPISQRGKTQKRKDISPHEIVVTSDSDDNGTQQKKEKRSKTGGSYENSGAGSQTPI